MFEEIERELQRLDRGKKIPVHLPLDTGGYLDRRCPSQNCQEIFKVHFEDWKGKVPDDLSFCPICGHSASPTEWNTDEQAAYLKDLALKHVANRIGKALQADAEKSKRRPTQPSLVYITLSYKPAPEITPIPPQAFEALTQYSECEKCACRFNSTGPAYFCPACGHNSALLTFGRSVQTSIELMGGVNSIRSEIASNTDGATAENALKLVIESTYANLVGSFQRFAEALYAALPPDRQGQVTRNAFQNLERSNGIWSAAIGTDYVTLLGPEPYRQLNICFQRRHLLAHREAIVDQDYISKSGDSSYRVGQRLVVRSDDVSSFAELLLELSARLRQAISRLP